MPLYRLVLTPPINGVESVSVAGLGPVKLYDYDSVQISDVVTLDISTTRMVVCVPQMKWIAYLSISPGGIPLSNEMYAKVEGLGLLNRGYECLNSPDMATQRYREYNVALVEATRVGPGVKL